MPFRVDLSVFRGPLDLLLYLVRKHEVDVLDLPIAEITDQYLAHLSVLEQLDVNAVGDFLELASTLIEIKSRLVLPHGGEEVEEFEDPRRDLVRRLLQYKKFKDAASMLEERSRSWQEHFPRQARDVAETRRDLAEEPIADVEMWDLVSAFGRILRESAPPPASNIVYDDTPIHVYMERIHTLLKQEQRVALGDLFQPGMHKSAQVGMFLAILELVRHHRVRTEQSQMFGEIYVSPGDVLEDRLDITQIDNYDHTPSP